MSRIAEVVTEVTKERFKPFDSDDGYCLRVTRQIVERALGLAEGEFYTRYRTHVSERNTSDKPWAIDIQKSLREGGYGVSFAERQEGDIICTHEIAPQGHIGVLYSPSLLVENTGSRRGVQISGHNRLSRVDLWPASPSSIEIFRLE